MFFFILVLLLYSDEVLLELELEFFILLLKLVSYKS